MEFKELRLSDRNLFEHFFCFDDYYLSTYHFSNIFIWRGLFSIFYILLDGCLCIFFKDKIGCFMYLPPLGREPDTAVIKSCFAIMDRFNTNKDVSRIENVEEKTLASYQRFGYRHYAKPGDYLCEREDIVYLKGNKFKSKRAAYNYFIKHYDFEFRPYLTQDEPDCLALYQRWAKQRGDRFSDLLYQGLLEDSFICHKLAMKNSLALGLIGYVIKIKDIHLRSTSFGGLSAEAQRAKVDKIAAYTFGFSINPRIFCILFEICDLAYRGISQFIFSQFCRQLSDYHYINIMDDSGLDNLRKLKLSYHPLRIIANYVIKRR